MLRCEALINFVSPPGIISMAYLILMMVPVATIIGCSGEGAGDPFMSNRSALGGPTASPSLDLAARDMEAFQARQPPGPSLATETPTDSPSDLDPGPLSTAGLPPPSDPSDNAMITVMSAPRGVTVRLNWEQSPNADTFGYIVYYGKQPAPEQGSCAAYEANLAVDAPPATIVGLDHETVYYFAVKNFDDSEDACSEEIMVVTPPAPSRRSN